MEQNCGRALAISWAILFVENIYPCINVYKCRRSANVEGRSTFQGILIVNTMIWVMYWESIDWNADVSIRGTGLCEGRSKVDPWHPNWKGSLRLRAKIRFWYQEIQKSSCRLKLWTSICADSNIFHTTQWRQSTSHFRRPLVTRKMVQQTE